MALTERQQEIKALLDQAHRTQRRAAMALTERQQEIKALLDQDKTPPEIAKQLGISDNAVYQHLRRMRKGTTAKGRGRARKPATPAVHDPGTPALRVATPLQAIRARRTQIENELKLVEHSVEELTRQLAKATSERDASAAKHVDELEALNVAEAALSRGNASRSSNGSGPKSAAKTAASAAA